MKKIRNKKGQFIKGHHNGLGVKKKPLSDELKKKLSEIHKLNPVKPWLGKHFSEEHKQKIGLKSKGNKHNLGRKLSEEHKRKISLSLIGNKYHKGIPGPKFSEETRRRLSEQKKGKKSSNWKGGITPINNKIRQSLEYKLWREAIFERDNYMCIWGGKEHGNRLQADHIKPFALFPELRFAIDNGRTLCIDCHRKTETWGGKIR